MIRFSLLGFPVAIHWLFWVNTALLGGGFSASTPEDFRGVILWMLAALISITIHELGHTFLMRRYGARASIMLYAFGGLAIPDRGFTRVQNIIVSLAGPVVQIGFGFIVLLLFRTLQPEMLTVQEFMSNFIIISIFWGILNLVPIYPLDGGHVLTGILGPRRVKITYITGIVCSIALVLWSVLRQDFFAVLLFGMLGYQNFQRFRGEPTASFLHPR